MTNSKSTRRALFTSALAMLMCVAMLIGTTFAWFTDTASTAVNKIQSGKLDVALEMATEWDDDGVPTAWDTAEGKTLEFKKAAGAPEGETVLWEPGCTYELPELRVVNKGNLALKYKVVITGIKGSSELNEAIEWTMKLDGTDYAVDTEHKLAASTATATDSDTFTISGHMDENAGNEYQDKTIEGISITVYATQDTVEFDSNGSNYDAGAEYNYKSATIMSGTDGKTTTLELGKTYTVGAATVTVDESGNISYTNNTDTPQTVTITTAGGTLTINAPLDTVKHYGEAETVFVTAVAKDSYHEFGKADILEIKKGRVVVEDGDNIAVLQVKPASNEAPIVAVPQSVVLETKLQVESGKSVEVAVIDGNGKAIEAETFKIETSGTNVESTIPSELVKVLNKDADGKVTLDEPKTYVAMIGTEPYENIAAAVGAVKADGTIKLISDITLSENTTLAIEKSVTIVGNGHKLIANYDGKTKAGKSGRVINIESPEPACTLKDITLTLSGVDIVGPTDNSYNRGVSAWGVSNLKIVMDNCSASANHYALNIASANPNVEVVVRNTTLTGYNAFQTWSTGTNATFENCTLIGMNQWANPSGSTANNSGTIVTNAATDSVLTFKGCRIEANAIGNATEYFLVVQDHEGETKGTSNVSVTFDDCKFFVNGKEVTGDAITNNMSTQSDAKVTIK